MAVYGAEHHPIDISQGLYLSPTPDNIPDGFCQELVNMFRTDRGTWEMRKGFTQETAVLTDAANSTTKVPIYPDKIPETRYKKAGFGELYGGPSLPHLWISYDDGSSYKLLQATGKRAATDTVNVTDQATNLPYGADSTYLDMCQYKEAIYGITSTFSLGPTIHVYGPIANWAYDGTAPALTHPSLSSWSVPGTSWGDGSLPSIFIYQNRAWVAIFDKLYYTDIPTPGGYPIVWNSGANFITLPASNVGSPIIWKCIPLNGILYIFTDKGIYRFNGQSANPLSWIIQFINNSCAVFSKNSVSLVNNIFLITDRKKLISFDGANPRDIGSAIQYVFNIYNSFSICPFLQGFILSCRYLTNTTSTNWDYLDPPGGNTAIWPQNRSFYFDGSVWSEIFIGTTTEKLDPVLGAVNKQASTGLQENISYLICHSEISASPKFCIVYYDVTRKDDALSSTRSISVSLRTKDVISSAFVNRQRLAKGKIAISKVKEGYIRCFSLLAIITTQMFKNGSSVAVTDTATGNAFKTTTLTDLADNNYEVKVPGAEFNSRVSVRIVPTTGVAPTTFASDLPTSVPIFEIKDVVLVVNTDYRDEPDTITT